MTELHRAYGGALYELSRDEGIEREMLAELGAVSSIIRENPDFVKLMNLASVPEEERLKSLDSCFHGKVQPYLLNFLKLIAERGSFGELPGCLAAFEERYNADNGIVSAEAVSARPLSEKETDLIKEKLEKLSGKKVVLTKREDPTLLGGVLLTMEGRQYDGSVRRRLEKIEKSLSDSVL